VLLTNRKKTIKIAFEKQAKQKQLKKIKMLPSNTISYTKEIPLNGAGDYVITTSYPTTILGFASIQGNVASDTKLVCGSNQILNNFSKDFFYTELNYVCEGTLKITKTGNDQAMIIVNYVNYNNQLVATSTPTIYAGFSQGELLIAFFFFIIMLAGVFSFIVDKFTIFKRYKNK